MTQALRVFVLAAWTAFFVWLIASDEMYRYVGPRTYWVIWFGAGALGSHSLARSLLRSDLASMTTNITRRPVSRSAKFCRSPRSCSRSRW